MSRGAALALISPWASDQWGMITAGQARRLGVSRLDLNRLVDDRTLEPIPGAARVYRLTGAPEDPDLDPARACWLQLGGSQSWEERIAHPDAIFSHRSAAHIRGLGDLIPSTHEFYVPKRKRPDRSDVTFRLRTHLDPHAWEIWSALPVCTIETIITDLLHEGEDESAVAQIAQDALRDGLIDRQQIRKAASGYARAYGHRTLANFVAALTNEETLTQ